MKESSKDIPQFTWGPFDAKIFLTFIYLVGRSFSVGAMGLKRLFHPLVFLMDPSGDGLGFATLGSVAWFGMFLYMFLYICSFFSIFLNFFNISCLT